MKKSFVNGLTAMVLSVAMLVAPTSVVASEVDSEAVVPNGGVGSEYTIQLVDRDTGKVLDKVDSDGNLYVYIPDVGFAENIEWDAESDIFGDAIGQIRGSYVDACIVITDSTGHIIPCYEIDPDLYSCEITKQVCPNNVAVSTLDKVVPENSDICNIPVEFWLSEHGLNEYGYCPKQFHVQHGRNELYGRTCFPVWYARRSFQEGDVWFNITYGDAVLGVHVECDYKSEGKTEPYALKFNQLYYEATVGDTVYLDATHTTVPYNSELKYTGYEWEKDFNTGNYVTRVYDDCVEVGSLPDSELFTILSMDEKGMKVKFHKPGTYTAAVIFNYPTITSIFTGGDFEVLVKEPALTPTPEPLPVGSYYRGDANLSGGVDASDALEVLKHVVSLITLPELPARVADMNVDSVLAADDALEILKTVVHLRGSEVIEL